MIQLVVSFEVICQVTLGLFGETCNSLITLALCTPMITWTRPICIYCFKYRTLFEVEDRSKSFQEWKVGGILHPILSNTSEEKCGVEFFALEIETTVRFKYSRLFH